MAKHLVLARLKVKQPLSEEINVLEVYAWNESPGASGWLHIGTADFSGNIRLTPAMKRELVKRLKGGPQ